MKNILSFCKKETVLCIAIVLALVSSCAVPPDAQYKGYIDYRTLAVLFCLMIVMAGLQRTGMFKKIADSLLARVKSSYGLILVLVFLCFFFSMAITNDVALITFVPFTFTILDMLGKDQRKRLILPVVAMQTIAANLGSMLTPIGNPQNLYLYGKSGITIGGFIMLMMPYTILSLLMLAIWSIILGKRCKRSGTVKTDLSKNGGQGINDGTDAYGYIMYIYIGMFVLCLLAVGHIIPWQALLAAVLVTVLVADRSVLACVDYSLLFTFAGFFIFIGNAGRLPVFRDFLQGAVVNREVVISIIASQFISNVPAALLLSGFTQNYADLIVGVNLGGLGTLIASMASLISYKYIASKEPDRKGAYIWIFTLAGLVFLAALVLLYAGFSCVFCFIPLKICFVPFCRFI